jgi:hypothetical protein
MAMTQITTITNKSGTAHATQEDLMNQMESDVPSINSNVDFIRSCVANGTMVAESVLSADGKSAVITRVWDDATWTEWQALGGGITAEWSDGGWTVVNEYTSHFGITTRQDDSFGE